MSRKSAYNLNNSNWKHVAIPCLQVMSHKHAWRFGPAVRDCIVDKRRRHRRGGGGGGECKKGRRASEGEICEKAAAQFVYSITVSAAARPPHLTVPFIITSMELPCCPYLNDDLAAAANGGEAASEDSFCGEIFGPLTTKGRGDRERGF